MNILDINLYKESLEIKINEKTNYIYLIKLREFIKTNENIYKIGRTSQNGLKRINQYPKGSELILFRKCIDCIKLEAELIKKFKLKYKHQPIYGNEYFEGNEIDIVKDINKIIDEEINNELIISNNYDYFLEYKINKNILSINNDIPKNNIYKNNKLINNNKLIDKSIKKTNTLIDLSNKIIINTYKDLVDITDNKIFIKITDKNKKNGYYQLENDNKSYHFGNDLKETLLDILYNNFSSYTDIGYINIIDNNYISCNKFHSIIDENKDIFYKLIFYEINYDNVIKDLLL
jgi:hypothetical protein